MKNKRGVAEGIDWILGVGIFILSITFIFILFKPGVTPLHDKETLLDIVQNGFEDEALWSITEVPIFLSPLYDELHDDTAVIFFSGDGFDLNPDDDIDAPDNNYGDQLDVILRDAGHSNMKLFYITRLIEGSEESFPSFRAEHTRELQVSCDSDRDDDEEDIEEYEGEAESFCRGLIEDGDEGGESSEGGRHVRELCEDSEVGDRERGAVRRTRELYVDYTRGRCGASEPYSSIERENELNFFINDQNILDDDGIIVAEAEDLIAPAYLDTTKTKYVLTVASKPINFAVPENFIGLDTLRKACYTFGGEFPNPFDIPFPAGVDSIGQLPPDTCFVLYELGAKKSISGVHLPSILALENFEGSGCETGYDCLREEWKFPALRDFMIEIETIPEASTGEVCNPDQQLCYKLPEKKPGPPLNVNTFVRQFNSFLLTDDGVKIPIIVRITIW